MSTATPQINFSWDFLEKFQVRAIHNFQEWQSIARLIQKSEQAIKPHIEECHDWELRWKKKLLPLCGDQTTINWSKFRPLRRNREEDWSDWLAWLLETSQKGILAESLFAKHMNCQSELFISPNVKREEPLDGRRADIVIPWKTQLMTHIEVKIWDRNFDKTFETAKKLHETAPNKNWHDFILIPSQSQEAWNEVAQKYSSSEAIKVTVILWDDVARGLRRCLWHERESVFWRAWAWVFCRVIETELLGLGKLGGDSTHPKIQMILQWLSVLKINPEEKYE
jgi:hypothetical protein